MTLASAPTPGAVWRMRRKDYAKTGSGTIQPWAVESFSCRPVCFLYIIADEMYRGGVEITPLPRGPGKSNGWYSVSESRAGLVIQVMVSSPNHLITSTTGD
jgi:hypothetical protein